MSNVFGYVKEFEGIIGAVAGTISTLIVTQLFKNLGKLNIYINSWSGKFNTYKDVGCSQLGKSDDDLYDYNFSFELQLYNSCDYHKIIRNIVISFESNKNVQIEVIPHDESTRTRTSWGSRTDEIKVMNINPKEIVHLNLLGYIREEDLGKLNNIDSILLKFYNEKNKAVKKIITKKLVNES